MAALQIIILVFGIIILYQKYVIDGLKDELKTNEETIKFLVNRDIQRARMRVGKSL